MRAQAHTSLADLLAGVEDSPAALLVQIARPRLTAAGLQVPRAVREETGAADPPRDAELHLYGALAADGEPDPYGRYNAMMRRLTSCEAALEQRMRRG
jgi:hypothetical protein